MKQNLLIILLALAVFLNGCTNLGADAAWKKAAEADSVQAYQTFMEQYPADANQAEARKRIEALQWKAAQQTGTTAAYEHYLKTHPSGPYTREAQNRLEELDWQATLQAGTLSAYNAYLSKYPQGMHPQEARAALEKFDWLQTGRVNTVPAYQAFLKKYPQGRYAKNARAGQEKLIWEQARRKRQPDAIEAFLRQYPDSSLAGAAKEELRQLDWLRARKNNTPAGYQKFLAAYPTGKYSHEALILGSIVSLKLSLEELPAAKSVGSSPFSPAAPAPSAPAGSPGHKRFLIARFTLIPLKNLNLSIQRVVLMDAKGRTVAAQDVADTNWLVPGTKPAQKTETTFAPGVTGEFSCKFPLGGQPLKGARIVMEKVDIPLREIPQ